MRMSVYRCKCAKTEVLELAALKMRGYAEVGGKAFLCGNSRFASQVGR